jgi:pterin-4a-carbinolamine dehydratase
VKRLSHLHEEFIDKAHRSMLFGRLPVKPLESGVAIVPSEKWEKLESPLRLRKHYNFMSQEKRNLFVAELFEYETKTGHNATITVEEGKVTLDVRTKDVDQITELDKEYAKFADVLFRDVVYSSSEDET